MLIQNLLQEGTWVDNYRIVRKLGRGGFGITYLAQEYAQTEGGSGGGQPLREVAMKEYFPNGIATRPNGHTVAPIHDLDGAEVAFQLGLKAFFAEAQALAQLDHENIVQIHRVFERNGTAYFVMPFLRGESLRTLLRREGTLSEERTRRLLLPVLSGLASAHARGILHRDLKPDNVMIRESDGRPLLIDFGTARAETASDSQAYTRYSELVAYTPGYAAFEQYGRASRQNLHGPQTDVYGFAAMMYEAISGEAPVESASRVAEMHDDREDPLTPASARLLDTHGYSRAFLAAVDWGLEVIAKDRPQTLNDFRKALDGKLAVPGKTLQRIERHGGSVEAFTQPAPLPGRPAAHTGPGAGTAAPDTAPRAITAPQMRTAQITAPPSVSRVDPVAEPSAATAIDPPRQPQSKALKRHAPLIGGAVLAVLGLSLVMLSRRPAAPSQLLKPPASASTVAIAPAAAATIAAPTASASIPPAPTTAVAPIVQPVTHVAAAPPPKAHKPAVTAAPPHVAARPAPSSSTNLASLLKIWGRRNLSVSSARRAGSVGSDQCAGQPALQVLSHDLGDGPQTYRGGSVEVDVTFRYCGSSKIKGRMQWRVMYQGAQLAEDDSSESLETGDWHTSMKVKIPDGTPTGTYVLDTRYISTAGSIDAPVDISVSR